MNLYILLTNSFAGYVNLAHRVRPYAQFLCSSQHVHGSRDVNTYLGREILESMLAGYTLQVDLSAALARVWCAFERLDLRQRSDVRGWWPGRC